MPASAECAVNFNVFLGRQWSKFFAKVTLKTALFQLLVERNSLEYSSNFMKFFKKTIICGL